MTFAHFAEGEADCMTGHCCLVYYSESSRLVGARIGVQMVQNGERVDVESKDATAQCWI